MKQGDIIRNMTDEELSSFLSEITCWCHEAGYHGNNLDFNGNCYCDGVCPLEGALSLQKETDRSKHQDRYGYEVFCSKESILKWLAT